MEGKNYQCMEMEVYKDVKKPEGRLDLVVPKDWRIYCAEVDEGASTCDPEKMKQNFRFSVAYSVINGNTHVIASNVDPKDEFIVSPEFILALLPHRKRKIEGAKLNFAKRTTRSTLRTIQRKEIFCKRIRRVLKSKNKALGLQKYWEKIQNKKLKKQKKLEDKRAKKAEKAAREAAIKKSEYGLTTVVAKADWFHMVTLQSVESLAYKAYINDEILDYGMALAMKRHRPGQDAVSSDVHGWTSYFFESKEKMKLKSQGFYRQLIKRVPNLLALKYMIVPAVRENHWFMIVVCQPFPDEADVLDMERKAGGGQFMRPYSKALYLKWLTGPRRPHVLVFDSLVYRPRRRDMLRELKSYHRNTADRVLHGIFALHRQLWSKSERAIEFDEASEEFFHAQIPYHVMIAPGQDNTYDCGLYVITYVMLWFKELRKVNDDFMAIYKKEFYDAFPHKGILNLRHSLYKTIEDWCANTAKLPGLKESVAEYAVPPYPGLDLIKSEVEGGEEPIV